MRYFLFKHQKFLQFTLALYLFIDETLSSSILKKQVRKLLVTIDNQYQYDDDIEMDETDLFIGIFAFFVNLTDLTVAEFSYRDRVRLYLGPAPSAAFSSSTLLKLTIKVAYFDDCLFILDGRFNQLQTLHIDLDHTFPPRRTQNEVSFPTKCLGIVKEKKSILSRTKSLI